MLRMVCVASLLIVSLTATAWSADTINRVDGTRVSGKITSGSKSELKIKPTIGDEVAVPASEISSVNWDDATADFRLGLSDENGGRFDSAIERITKSKAETETQQDQLKKDFDFILARIAARQALADASKLDAAITQLEQFLKTASDHYRYYEAMSLLGSVQLAKQDYAAARTTFENLAQSPSNDYKLSAKIAQGRILMGEGQSDAAAKMFDDAISAAGSSAAEQARKFEAMLGKTRALAAQGQHEEALKVIEEVTSKAPADATALQAEAYVLQGNSFQALNRNKEAVLAYLHVDILFPRESAYHAEALYHMSRLWKTVQFPERGLDAEAKLAAAYPNSTWTKKLAAAPQ